MENKFQKILNQYLALDPESKTRLAELNDKVVTIELLNVNTIIQLIFTKDQIILKTEGLVKPNTVIKGTPLSLLHVSLNRENRKRFFAEDIVIQGDLELGQKIIDLFDSLEIDWEEYLSHWVGDVSAHHIGRISKLFRNFSKNLHATLADNIKEYIHEEIDLFPPKEALVDFYDDVDLLRMDTDRLEARIARLTNLLNTKEEA